MIDAPGPEAGATLARLVDLTKSRDAASMQTSGSVCLDGGDTGPRAVRAFGAEPSGGDFEDHLPDDPRSFKTRDARFAEALLSAFPRDAQTNAARLALDASLAAAGVRARTPETVASGVARIARGPRRFPAASSRLVAVVDAAPPRALRRVAGLDTDRRLPTRF